MNVTFRRDDGREFAFEMPDGQAIAKQGRAFLDGTVYRMFEDFSLELIADAESLDASIGQGDKGEIMHFPSPGEAFEVTVTQCRVYFHRGAYGSVKFKGRVAKPIPKEDIREWLESPPDARD